MKSDREGELERALRSIEFPGEDGERIFFYLEDHASTDRIMEQVQGLSPEPARHGPWAVFCFLNLVVLLLFGLRPALVQELLDVEAALVQFCFLFLGLTFLGSLIGLILTLDTSWFDELLNRGKA